LCLEVFSVKVLISTWSGARMCLDMISVNVLM